MTLTKEENTNCISSRCWIYHTPKSSYYECVQRTNGSHVVRINENHPRDIAHLEHCTNTARLHARPLGHIQDPPMSAYKVGQQIPLSLSSPL